MLVADRKASPSAAIAKGPFSWRMTSELPFRFQPGSEYTMNDPSTADGVRSTFHDFRVLAGGCSWNSVSRPRPLFPQCGACSYEPSRNRRGRRVVDGSHDPTTRRTEGLPKWHSRQHPRNLRLPFSPAAHRRSVRPVGRPDRTQRWAVHRWDITDSKGPSSACACSTRHWRPTRSARPIAPRAN